MGSVSGSLGVAFFVEDDVIDLGARADVVPPEWNVVLAKLQDDMPADRPSYVTTTLEKQLGCKIDECFHEFQHNPIASASIAQVHEAWLRDKQGRRGPKVAVKIQHESIATIMYEAFLFLSLAIKGSPVYCVGEVT